ncbi:hypothetical protein [Streptomyces sp. NPDC085932]|uniref:hypothetical protein n=1 Tax=Streptomyces sp. NPDC085932 TaxID=3365741 RepID=UPI0037D752EA
MQSTTAARAPDTATAPLSRAGRRPWWSRALARAAVLMAAVALAAPPAAAVNATAGTAHRTQARHGAHTVHARQQEHTTR